MLGAWLASIKHIGMEVSEKVQSWSKAKTKPAMTSQVLETAQDLLRSKAELIAEMPYYANKSSCCNGTLNSPS